MQLEVNFQSINYKKEHPRNVKLEEEIAYASKMWQALLVDGDW